MSYDISTNCPRFDGALSPGCHSSHASTSEDRSGRRGSVEHQQVAHCAGRLQFQVGPATPTIGRQLDFSSASTRRDQPPAGAGLVPSCIWRSALKGIPRIPPAPSAPIWFILGPQHADRGPSEHQTGWPGIERQGHQPCRIGVACTKGVEVGPRPGKPTRAESITGVESRCAGLRENSIGGAQPRLSSQPQGTRHFSVKHGR